MARFGAFGAALMVLTALGWPTTGHSQTDIGRAVTIQRDVNGLLGGRDRRLASGDGVFADERIRTGAESAAALRFKDETSLSVGPSAEVALDRFVFNPDSSARSAVVTVGRGALRWTSGNSRPAAYRINTPLAVLGVRGTVIDMVIEPGREVFVLREGRIEVCRRGGTCVLLTVPGSSVVVTRAAITRRAEARPAPVFADRCLAGTAPACTVDTPFVTVAEAPSRPVPLAPWTGPSIGIHVDGLFGGGDSRFGGSTSVTAAVARAAVPGTVGLDEAAFGAGLHVGWSWRFGAVVTGIDLDVDVLSRNVFSSTALPNLIVVPPVTAFTDVRSRLDVLATLRPRVGMLMNEALLVYLTGGVAIGHVKVDAVIDSGLAAPFFAGARSAVELGWVAGLGAEWLVAPGWSITGEILHFDLGRTRVTMTERTGLPVPGDPAPFGIAKVRTSGEIVRLGARLRF